MLESDDIKKAKIRAKTDVELEQVRGDTAVRKEYVRGLASRIQSKAMLFIALFMVVAVIYVFVDDRSHKGKIEVPSDYTHYENLGVNSIVNEFQDAGFTNVIVEDVDGNTIQDYSQYQVVRVTVAGDSDFYSGAWCAPDAVIRIIVDK